jgi:hypothetical protein
MRSIDGECTDVGALDNFCDDAKAQLEEVLLLREGELLATMESVLKYNILQQGRVVYQWREARKKHQQENQKGQKEDATRRSPERSVDKEKALSRIRKQAAVDEDQEKTSSIKSPCSRSGTTPGHSKRQLDKATSVACSPNAKRAREEEPRRAPVETSASREEEDTIVQDSVPALIPKIADTKLEDLGDDALLHIASFLACDLPRPQEIEAYVMPQHMMGANTARRIWGYFGALSKHSRERLRPLLLVEADFYGVNDENYFSTILWLSNNKIRLGRLRIRTGLCNTNYVALLLKNCDTNTLDDVEVMINVWDLNTIVGPMENAEEFPDLTSKYFGPAVEDAEKFGIPTEALGPNITTPELHREITRQGQSIRKLKINNMLVRTKENIVPMGSKVKEDVEHLQATKTACKEISNMRCLRDLGVGVTCDSVFRAFLRCAENHPNLEIFAVGSAQHVRSIKVRIQSKSLKVIDFRNAGKSVWVTRCTCPSLERFRCMGGPLGNGVRHYNPDEHFSRQDDWHLTDRGGLSAGENRFHGMKVPDTCIVEFD